MNKKCFILVHGAWHASWCWHKVAPLLKQAGHQVYTPDLPGHGTHLLPFKKISLKTYVDYLITFIDKLPLDLPITLVGHSFAGIVISQVAEWIPERLNELVYLAAFVPTHQRSLMEEASHSLFDPTLYLRANPLKNEMNLLLDKPEKIKEIFYQHCDDETVAFALSLLQSEPLRPLTEKVNLSHARFGSVKKKYILCLQDMALDMDNQRRMAAQTNMIKIEELNCDHSPFFSKVKEIVRIFLN